MGRNNGDFQSSALYHGTVHPFQIGDVVSPIQSSSGNAEAFAGKDMDLAYKYAEHKSRTGETGTGKQIPGAKGAEPRVYRVEPVDASEDLTSHGYPEGFYVSQKGFKVVERVK